MRNRYPFALLTSLALTLTLAACLAQGTEGEDAPAGEETGTQGDAILNGTDASAEASLRGLVLINGTHPIKNTGGTGVLLTEQFVITARHVVEGTTSLKLTVGSWIQDVPVTPDSVRMNQQGHDIALIKLPSRFPSPIDNRLTTYADDYSASGTYFIGQDLTCYGYGNNLLTGSQLTGFGTLRKGTVRLGGYIKTDLTSPFTPASEYPAYPSTFLHYILKPGLSQMVAPGDSGGPCFGVGPLGEEEIVGITKGGPNVGIPAAGGAFGTHAWATRGTAYTEETANIIYRELLFSQQPLFLPGVTSHIDDTTGWNDRVVLADLNGDGRLDYIYTGANDIFTKLSVGDGSFGPLVTTHLAQPANQNRTYIQRLYQHTKLSFPPQVPPPYDAYDWVEVQSDRVVTRASWLSGTFGLPTTSMLGAPPAGSPGWNDGRVFFTNVTDDKLDDLVYVGPSFITTRANLGAGSISPSQVTVQYPGQNWASTDRMFFADIDGSGVNIQGNRTPFSRDFIYAGLNSVTVLPNQMSGTFGLPVVTPITTIPGGLASPYRIDFRDVNGDGREDLVYLTSRAIYVALANANRTFNPPVRTLFEYSSDWDLREDDFRYSITNVSPVGRVSYVGQSTKKVVIKEGREDGTLGRMKIGAFQNPFSPQLPDVGWCDFANVAGASGPGDEGPFGSDDRICITTSDIIVYKRNNEFPRGYVDVPPRRVDYTDPAPDQQGPMNPRQLPTTPSRVRIKR